MSKEQKYALELSKAALKKAGGNTKQAEAYLRQQIKTDHDLLLGLTEPYLSGVLIHALQRAAKGLPLTDMIVDETLAEKHEPMPKVRRKAQTSNKTIPKQGMDGLIKALAGNVNAEDKNAPKAKPSQSHIDAITQMAKFTIKKKK